MEPRTPLTLPRGRHSGRGSDTPPVGDLVRPGQPPIRVYGRPPRRRRRWLRIVLWSLGILVLLVAVAAGALYLYLRDAVETITHTSDPRVQQVQETGLAPPPATPGAPRVALVIGEDRREGEETWRSDTMMLVRLDPRTRTLSVMGFPRDLVVDVPGQGRMPINQAFALGQEPLALQAVTQLTGITPNYLVPLEFEGFERLVNAFGPVWVEIDRRYYNRNLGTDDTNFEDIDLQQGYQPLDGARALDYVRYRHSDNDVVRVGRQQAFVRELKGRIDVWSAARDLLGLIRIAKDHVKILGAADGGAPDLDTFQEYGQALADVEQVVNVQLATTPSPLRPDAWLETTPEEVQRQVDRFLHPDTTLAERLTDRDVARRAPDAEAGADPGGPPFAKATARVAIRNGASDSPLTGDVETLLAARGWKAAFADGNADTHAYLHTVAFHRDTPAARAAATALAAEFRAGEVQPLTAEKAQALEAQGTLDADVVLVVGRDWSGELAAAAEAALPDAEPAALGPTDPDLDAEAWAAAQRETPLALERPTRLAEGMRLGDPGTADAPAIRTYRVGGFQAVHATYTGSDRYEGGFTVQAIGWRHPPIAEAPGARRTLPDGRVLELHYNGARIHRIVWRRGGVTYWISNSLVDHYANATMIAIARSFVPLGRP